MSRAYGELRSQGLIRTGLVLLAIPSGIIAIWGLLSPHGFYRDFPGLPVRTRITMARPHAATARESTTAGGTEITTTLVSVKQDPLNDVEFTIPTNFQEMSMPDIFGGKKTAPSASPNP